MQQAWTSLAAGHDLRLLLLAALVCFIGLFLTLRLFARALASDANQEAWVTVSALGAGATVWAAHFLAMAAYQPQTYTGYEPMRASFAFMAALAGMTASFWAAAGPRQPWREAMAGGLFGIGVTAALSAGLSALQAQGALVWNPLDLLLATPIGVLLATMGFRAGGDFGGVRSQLAAAGILAAAAAMIHLGAVAGVSIRPDAAAAVPPHLVVPMVMALIVLLAAGLTLGGGFLVAGAADTYVRSVDRLRLREIIDSIPEAVGYCDAQDRMVFWNARYSVLGADADMRIRPGMPFREILAGALARGGYKRAIGREDEWLAERMAQHTAEHAIHEHPLNDGRWLRIEERRTAEGGVIMVCVDITDLKRNAEALTEARDEAERANRAKSEFLANMSHEIRTPLNGVIGLADVLARTELATEQREIVDIIRSSGATLERLLTDVLDLARIESGRLEIRREAFHLGALVRQVAGLAELRARDKGVAFRLRLDPAAEIAVEGDPDRLKQILLNLLSNAVKFTSEGEVGLSVSPAFRPSGSAFRFETHDTGVGFSMEDKARLFERFEQADGSITRRFGGTGLGLPIAYQLTTLMGGIMDAEGVEGKGATFMVELPLPVATVEAQAPAEDTARAPAASDEPSQALRVLLAEDHPTNRKVVELMLQMLGVELTAVENGAEAIKAFRAGRFDIVLMDVQMPVMDGLAAIRAIRAYERAEGLASTPIIALTANALPEHVRASAEAGANAHLSKPITAAALLPAIERLTSGVGAVDAETAAA